MPDQTPRGSSISERLNHIRELWVQLAQAHDPKERDRLEQLIRQEAEAYKRVTGRPLDH